MSDYSQIITLANLNTVYKDIRDRIDALGDVYSPKGSVENLKDLYSLHINYADMVPNKEKPSIGHLYNVVNETGDNYVCIDDKFPEQALTDNNFATYWAKVGGIFELASDSTAGLVFLGAEGEDTTAEDAEKIAEGSDIKRVLKMDAASATNREAGGAYVNIPLASNETYGLVSTGIQTFKGDKTFNNRITIGDTLFVGNTKITTNSISVGSKNGSTEAGSLTINGGSSVASSAEFGALEVEDKATVKGAVTFDDGLSISGPVTVNGESTFNRGLSVSDTVSVNSLSTATICDISSANQITGPKLVSDNIEATNLTATNLGSEFKKISNVYADTLDVKSIVSPPKVDSTNSLGIENNITIVDLTATSLTINNNIEADTATVKNLAVDETLHITNPDETVISDISVGETLSVGENSTVKNLKVNETLNVTSAVTVGKVGAHTWTTKVDKDGSILFLYNEI